MPNYKSLQEAQAFFDVSLINTKADLDAFTAMHGKDGGNVLYLGTGCGSHKLYATSQLEFAAKGFSNRFISYNHFLASVYENSKTASGKLLPELYAGTRQTFRYFPVKSVYYIEQTLPYNSWWAFSFLQHYGVPTPLIPFTGNVSAALYAAAQGATAVSGSYNLTDYVQLSFFDKASLQGNDSFYSIIKHCKEATVLQNPGTVTEALKTFSALFSFFNRPEQEGIYYLPNPSEQAPLVRVPVNMDIDLKLNLVNLSVLAQKGTFLVNFHEKEALESQWVQAGLPKLKRVLIHKSLAPAVQAAHPASGFSAWHEDKLAKAIYTEAVQA